MYFSADAYHDHRLLSGIPEGTDDITVGGSLPLEFNLDYMNGGTSYYSLTLKAFNYVH